MCARLPIQGMAVPAARPSRRRECRTAEGRGPDGALEAAGPTELGGRYDVVVGPRFPRPPTAPRFLADAQELRGCPSVRVDGARLQAKAAGGRCMPSPAQEAIMFRVSAIFAGITAAATLVSIPATPPSAQSQEYRFEAADQLVTGRGIGTVEIRLVRADTGQVVTGATVIASDLEMPMNGIGSMMGQAHPVSSGPQTRLKFVVSVPMDGEWLLGVTAKVPGRDEPIRGVVPIYVETRVPLHHRFGPSTGGSNLEPPVERNMARPDEE